MEKGLTQIYTGNGKGKTTAAMGLALRALGAGLRVYVGCFIKNMVYGEVKILRERFAEEEITIELFGSGDCLLTGPPAAEDIEAARKGLIRACTCMQSGAYDLVILDELCLTPYLHLIGEEAILRAMREKPEGTELVLTGRYATEAMMEEADLVTEMREVKHYYALGVEAREGMER